jgi:hypothetical protein
VLNLIDFGLTKQTSHIRMRKFKEEFIKAENLRLTGTPIYASVYSHMGSTQCYMKDDIESLVYMLIHLGRGRLPWLYVDVKPGDNYINIFNCKRRIDSNELAGSLPKGFAKLVDYARELDCLETPDYEYMRQIFNDMSSESQFGPRLGVHNPPKVPIDKRSFFIKAKSSNYQATRGQSAKPYVAYNDRTSLHIPGGPNLNS